LKKSGCERKFEEFITFVYSTYVFAHHYHMHIAHFRYLRNR